MRRSPAYWTAVGRDVADRIQGRTVPPFRARAAGIEARMEKEVAAVAATSGRVVAGPFLGEVGYELLYWIPFLRWAVEKHPSLRGRLTAISRGGVASWYHGVADEYVDAFALRTAEAVVGGRDGQKQREGAAFEAALLADADLDSGGPRLHPSMLYRLYYAAVDHDHRAFARSIRTDEGVVRGLAAVYESVVPPQVEWLDSVLPEEFVAVRFYARPSFRADEPTRAFVRETIRRLARRSPVVLLDTGMSLDDHADFPDLDGERVLSLGERMRPHDNLAVQSAAVARATALVGTYGGISYLGPMLGRPTVGFIADPREVQPWHLDLAQRIGEAAGWPSLLALRPQDVALGSLLA